MKRGREVDSEGPLSKRSRCDSNTSNCNRKSSMLFFAKAIIMHEIPFSMVDFPYFKSFIHSLQFFLNLPAPKSVMSACMKVYKMEKIKVQDMLNSVEC